MGLDHLIRTYSTTAPDLLIKEKQALAKKNAELRAMIRTIYLLTRPRKKKVSNG